MLDACAESSRVVLAVSVTVAFVTIAMSARLMGYIIRETMRIRRKLDLDRRISERDAMQEPGERDAVRPPAPRAPR